MGEGRGESSFGRFEALAIALSSVPPPTETARALLRATATLRDAVDRLAFSPPVACVYNPLAYAWAAHEEYVRRYGRGRKRVVFLGMNPGPFGMVQTGIPFGEVQAVRDWLQIQAVITPPTIFHPKRPILGYDCPRSEVSGRRLWGLFAKRFGTADQFFAEHFVLNYCPLAFVETSGANLTPDKLPARELRPVLEACDEALRRILEALTPEWVIGVGGFALERARTVLPAGFPKAGSILHPSPANPSANRDWEGTAISQLQTLGVWK